MRKETATNASVWQVVRSEKIETEEERLTQKTEEKCVKRINATESRDEWREKERENGTHGDEEWDEENELAIIKGNEIE